jgi:hypothetical protein
MVDVDGDSDLDLFVAMASGNRLYVNVGNGTLVESGVSRGAASYSGGGVVRGVTAADVDGDGDVDVLVFGSGPQQLYINNLNGSGWFLDGTASGLSLTADAASASFGDVDSDGDVDLLLGSSLAPTVVTLNDGRGHFNATSAVLGASAAISTAPVFVDVDGDGDIDVRVPAAGFINGVVAAGMVGTGVARVRVVSRSGRRACHGASVVVRRSTDAVIVSSQVVSTGIAPYDVLVASAFAGLFDIDVSFPSGRRHTKLTQGALSGLRLSTASSTSVPLVVVRNIPGIVSVRLPPSSDVYGLGSMLTAIVQSLGDERGLLASLCTINGVKCLRVRWTGGTARIIHVRGSDRPQKLCWTVDVSSAV